MKPHRAKITTAPISRPAALQMVSAAWVNVPPPASYGCRRRTAYEVFTPACPSEPRAVKSAESSIEYISAFKTIFQGPRISSEVNRIFSSKRTLSFFLFCSQSAGWSYNYIERAARSFPRVSPMSALSSLSQSGTCSDFFSASVNLCK